MLAALKKCLLATLLVLHAAVATSSHSLSNIANSGMNLRLAQTHTHRKRFMDKILMDLYIKNSLIMHILNSELCT